MGDGVSWPAGADEVIKGDLTAAAAYLTPAGGAVVTGVAPCGIADRDRGVLGYTTSLGFGKKLERIVADPHVALAFHAREHGFSASPAFVLAQGTAVVDLTPSRQRLEALIPQVERYMGEVKRGRDEGQKRDPIRSNRPDRRAPQQQRQRVADRDPERRLVAQPPRRGFDPDQRVVLDVLDGVERVVADHPGNAS